LSFALAVFAADRFVLRDKEPDRWTRSITLRVELVDPLPWNAEAPRLASLLRFLTGDIWHLEFIANGNRPPNSMGLPRTNDSVCLFSGGLDSLIGAIDLKAQKRNPLLVSQATPKEGSIQNLLASEIGCEDQRFIGKAIERFRSPYEPSQRSRSLLFLAYAAVCGGSLSLARGGGDIDLFIPENGLISLNPPLTLRRIGSLSTRTTHPYFITSLQRILQNVGIPVRLINPYGFTTKGEMLKNCANAKIGNLASMSYSCGKGKRLNMQCGRCVPCLIRRAAFRKAGLKDSTCYWSTDLSEEAKWDDVYSARMATTLNAREIEHRIAISGPLPHDRKAYQSYIDVGVRGVAELKALFATVKWR
jgi:hypothetical protein